MPYRYGYKKKTATSRRPAYRKKKSTYTRKRKSASKPSLHLMRQGPAMVRPERPLVQRGFLPFARSYRVKIPWAHTTGITAATGVTAVIHRYNLNSLNSPTFGGGGHQPMQFDQLSLLYSRYMVYAAKVTIDFSNPSNDGLHVGYNVYSAYSSDGAGKTLGNLAELRNCKMQPINDTGNQRRKFEIYVPIHNVFGIPKLVYNTDRAQYASLNGANPTTMCQIAVAVLDATAGISTDVHYKIGITYYAEMYEFVTQAQS